MSVTRANISIGLTVTSPVSSDPAAYLTANRNSVEYSGGNLSEALTPTSNPNATVHAVGARALSAGSATLDLRVLTGVNEVAVDLNGLKPRAVLLENPAANANPITIAQGATNGYTGLGSSFRVTLQPGQRLLLRLGAAGTAVSDTLKTFDLTGTGTQSLKYQIVAGT